MIKDKILAKSKSLIFRLFQKWGPTTAPITLFQGDLLKGQQVLVTGGAGRIGPAIIGACLAQGAHVVFTELSQELVLQTTNQYPDAIGVVVPQHNNDVILNFLEKADIVPDILINNVGLSSYKSFLEEDQSGWQDILNTNLVYPMTLTKEVTKQMLIKRKQGNILFISSVHQTLPARSPSYSASKAAIQMAVKELAVELAPHGIRVNGIAPGWVENTIQPFKFALLENRTIDPAYIAHAVVFLTSNELSRFTTGEVLTIDAGLTLYSGKVLLNPPRVGL